MTSIVDFLNSNSGAVQAISIVLLFVVTTFYAWDSHEMAKAAHRSLKQAIRPILTFGGLTGVRTTERASAVYLCWQNEGTGPALNIRCWVETRDTTGKPSGVLNRGRAWDDPEVSHQSLLFQDYLSVGRWVSTTEANTPQFVPVWRVAVPFDYDATAAFRVIAVYEDVSGNHYESKSEFRKGTGGEFEWGLFSCRQVDDKEAVKALSAAGHHS